MAKRIVSKVEEIEQPNRKVVLVADDEPLTFELINEFFKDANLSYKILKAETGRRAYRIAVSEIPDLIITDWIMPEFNGPDLIKKLKANPVTENIPVIMTTGAVFPDKEFNRVLGEGAIDYIRKPIDDKELIARVKTALALNESFREIRHNRESIRIKNQTLNFLMHETPNPVFYLDRMGCLLGCNENFEMLIGQRKSDLLGKTVYDFFPESYASELEASFYKLIDLDTVSRCELKMEDGKGKSRNLLLSYVGFGSSAIEIIIGSITDVTEIVLSENETID
ncbi:MAG: response regulator [Bacteroidetes bacterium]|nr:response regulator [Bacteroidota bacterium]